MRRRLLNVEANLADSTTRVAEIVEKFQREHNVPEDAVPGMEALLEQAMTRRKLAEGIKNFDDKNFDVQVAMKLGAEYFGGNPRELKRFVNSFRFQYYLWWARRAQNLSAQLVRWTVLSMKWPEVVRWIRRGGEHVAPSPDDKPGQSMQFRRLSSLQDISAETGDQIEWKRPWSLS